MSNQWGTICSSDAEYGSQYILADLVCNSFGTYRLAYGPANLSSNIEMSNNNPIVSGPIDCGYNYRNDYYNFYQCTSFPLNSAAAMSRCTPDQEWVVACGCKLHS